MPKKQNKTLFTIRKIRNANPRFPRIYRSVRERIWRFAVILLLISAGVASLFFFENSLVVKKFESNLIAADTSQILGSGFQTIGGFTGIATNPGSDKKTGGFTASGIKTINALIYNVKDYFKYIAGGVAVLYLIIAAFQIIMARDNEGITKGKKNLFWSVFALVLVFVVDIMVIAFYEGGGSAPGQSIFVVNPNGTTVENLTLLQNISLYFKINAKTIFSYIKTLVGAFSILFIVFAGVQMVTAGGSDEKIEKEKKYLMHLVTAFVTILLLDVIIFGVIYPEAIDGSSNPECAEFMTAVAKGGSLMAAPAGCRSAAELGLIASNQIFGVVRFFETLIGGIAIFFMVYSAVAIIASMGEDDIVKKHRTTLMWSLAGLVLVLVANTLITRFFFIVDPTTGTSSVSTMTGIQIIAGVTNFIATFVGILSVIAIIVAGFMWVANFGSDDVAGKAKKVILSAVIGVILSVSAYAIVNTITNANSHGGTGTNIGVSL
ncbi:MAG: hypothetical protein V2A63_00520 [Patescibacteria group bacterium]